MESSNYFANPEVLRIQWSDFESSSKELADRIGLMLIEIMDRKNWPAVSPQNLLLENIDLYKKIIVIKNFNSEDYFRLINPSYEIIEDESVLMHELCWSIETVEWNPFWVINFVPKKIRLKWLNSDMGKVEFIIDWDKPDKQELISFIIPKICRLFCCRKRKKRYL